MILLHQQPEFLDYRYAITCLDHTILDFTLFICLLVCLGFSRQGFSVQSWLSRNSLCPAPCSVLLGQHSLCSNPPASVSPLGSQVCYTTSSSMFLSQKFFLKPAQETSEVTLSGSQHSQTSELCKRKRYFSKIFYRKLKKQNYT